jgi:hypothetical protein
VYVRGLGRFVENFRGLINGLVRKGSLLSMFNKIRL